MNKISWNIKLLTILIIVAIIPATIIVVNVIGVIQDELKSTVNQQLIFSSNEIAQQIDEQYQKTFEVLELAKISLANENLSPQEKVNLLVSIIKTVDNILGINISYEPQNAERQEIVLVSKDSISVNGRKIPLEKLNFVSDSLNKTSDQKLFVSNLRYLKESNIWYQVLKVSIEINNSDNFYLSAIVNLNEIVKNIENHPLQKKGNIFLIDFNGERIYSSDNFKNDYSFLSIDGLKIASSKQNFSIVNNYKSPQDEEIVACFASPESIPWVIITAIKESDAYGIVSEIMNIFLIWIGISLSAAAIISIIFSKRLSNPIKKMSEAAHQIAKGNFRTAIKYEAPDSIGALGQSLVQMGNDLEANFKEIEKQKSQLEDYSKNLELKVEERTSDLIKANEEINRSYQKVLDLNKEKNEFLGIAAHDLKNPLTSIKGFTDILLSDHDLPIELRQNFLEEILGASNRMFDIVTNLLDVNAIEEGRIKINKEVIPISVILNQIYQQNNENAVKKEIKINLQQNDDDVLVDVDKNLTLQIIDNLVSNAIKFSPMGKNIYINYHFESKVGFLSLSIKDEGQGFSDEDKQKVFGKFARLSAKPTAGEHSTGLGLSIVKRLVELQNAKIRLESEFGKGATFILDLPLGVK
ncbi:MAG TPA: ATP-binding protein [Ignavibacteriaceae bacterium]|nr:ATP-binding protein [Ignavibacteriaceae bacterium]